MRARGRETTIKIQSVVICDDVRHEKSGKDILVGVYSGEITVPRFPAALGLMLWIEHTLLGKGEIPVAFRLATDRGTQLFEARVTLSVATDEGSGAIALGPIPVPMTDPGTLVIEMRQREGGWAEIKRKKMAAASIIPQQQGSS